MNKLYLVKHEIKTGTGTFIIKEESYLIIAENEKEAVSIVKKKEKYLERAKFSVVEIKINESNKGILFEL